jgi:hypothetical protein
MMTSAKISAMCSHYQAIKARERYFRLFGV